MSYFAVELSNKLYEYNNHSFPIVLTIKPQGLVLGS